MQANETTIPAQAAVAAVAEKKNFRISESVTLVGDGVKSLLQLLLDQIATVTGLETIPVVGASIQTSVRITNDAESSDLS